MIEIKIDDREVQNLLKDLASRVKDRRPLMQKIAGIMHDAVEENFEAEGRPRWKPSKRALRQKGKTLQDTGKLAASITARSNNDSAIVGTNKVYAAIHQFGFKGTVSIKAHTRKVKSRGITTVKAHSRSMNIPARPYLKLTDKDLENIKEAVKDYLKPR